jgi:hypothetical protein
LVAAVRFWFGLAGVGVSLVRECAGFAALQQVASLSVNYKY